MHAAKFSGPAALVLLMVLTSAAARATIDRPVTPLPDHDEESTEQSFIYIEQTTDADFLTEAQNVASNEALPGGASSSSKHLEDTLHQKVEALSSDMFKFIQNLSKTNDLEQQKLLLKKDGFKLIEKNSLVSRMRIMLENCVKKFGASCIKIVPKYEYGRSKREAQKSSKQYETESVNYRNDFEHLSPSSLQDKSSHLNIAAEDKPENESVTQYVFRELQNLLYESRSDLQDEIKEVKFVDVADGDFNKPAHSEYPSDFEVVWNPSNINPDYKKKAPPLKFMSTTQPAQQNSLSTTDIFVSKFHTSNPKNRLSEPHSHRSPFSATTESGINFTPASEPRPYQSTHSSGRYPRSTTSQGSTFQRNDPYYFRTPTSVHPVHDVTQGYGEYIVDYVSADYETTNPKQTLKELLSQSLMRNPSSENIQYEIVSSQPESYDDSDFPMYEYFVISEEPEPEPSYLPLPTYPEQTYIPEKQVFEETRVPVQLVTGNRVSPASSTRFISTTPLSNDELYQIIKERIPSSTNRPQSFTVEEPPVKTLQQESPKLSAENQLKSPSKLETPRSTPSYSFKRPVREEITQPSVVIVQEESEDNMISSVSQSEPAFTYSFESSIPEETVTPLVVNIQESENINLPNLQTELSVSPETTVSDSTVVTNLYTSPLPPSNAPAVTTPIIESTATEEVGLTTTLQDLITAIENQLGTTAIAVEEPVRTDIPMQVTVTSDEITVSGPDTQSISSLLYELRQPLLTTPSPTKSFVLPHVDSLKAVEVDPMQFAEFTSSVNKFPKKPSITSLFSGSRPLAVSSISTRIQSIPEDVYRTSAPVQTESLTPITPISDEIQVQLSNSYGIPEFLIKSELIGDKLQPDVTDTHIFGIPKAIIESELKDNPEESLEPETLIMTATTNSIGNEPVNLIDQHFVHEFEDNSGDSLPFNGIPLSMLNAELRRAHPEAGDGYNLRFEKDQFSTPASTFYVVEDDSRSSTVPFLTTEKTDGSFFNNFMSIFSQF